ncbi:MAG: M48 family metalloprotease, partial [Burkholderiales bacterium]|nr:M48 family metalloprotease [Burkholderiales bacterium]
EIAHALQEHAREQMGKNLATRGVIELGAALLGLGGGGRMLADLGAQLLSLKYGRDDEIEADRVGLVLAARSGYDPRAGVSLWRKMSAAGGDGPPQFLSTHPSGPNRIRDIEAALPKVHPRFAAASRPQRRFEPAASRQRP